MRYALVIWSTLLLSISLSGQNGRYVGYSSGTFNGLKTEDGNLFYLAYRGEAKTDTLYSFMIEIFDAQLERQVKERVPTKYNSDLVDVTAHRGGLLFYIKSSSDGLVYYFDASGQKVWQKTLERDKNKYNDVQLLSLGNQGILIVRPDKEGKNGFRMTVYDDQLNEKWSQTQFPDKGSIDFEKVKVTGDKIGVQAYYKRSFFSNKYERRLYLFAAADGKLQYQHELGNEDNEQLPQEFVVNEDGSAFVMGYVLGYGDKAEALFYTEVDAGGKQRYLQKFSLEEELRERLTSERATQYFALDKAPLINVHNIVRTADGYQILGEKYHYIPEPSEGQQEGVSIGSSARGKLYVMDYVLLDISGTGKLESLRSIGKPHKRIDALGYTISKEHHAAEYFEDLQFFAYRFIADKDGVSRVVSLNWHNNSPYIGFTSLDEEHENILNRIYLKGEVSDRENENYTQYSSHKEGPQVPLETYHNNLLPYNEAGKMLYYNYEGGELAMEVMAMEAPMPEAQNGEMRLTGIPGQAFQGLHALGGEGYFTFYRSEAAEGGRDLYVYHQLDLDLSTIGRSVLSVPEASQFVGQVAIGEGQVMVFQNRYERSWSFYGLDSAGVFLSQNRIALSESAHQVPTGNLLLEPAGDGFFMIQPFRDTVTERNGYEVIRMNRNLKVRWTWSHLAEINEVLQLVTAGGGPGVLAIVHNQHPRSYFQQVSHHIMTIDDQSGKLLFEKDLYDGEDSGFPEFLRVTDDGSIVISGMYFKGRKFDKVNSEGQFFMKLVSDGEERVYTKTPWKMVEESIKEGTETEFLISGKTKVLIQDMVLMPDGSIRVIGELYRKSLGTTGVGFLLGDDLGDRAFSIFDFVVFNYARDGSLTGMYRISKAEQNIELTGRVGHQRGLSLSLMMRRYNMFSYLKTVREQDNPRLVFTNNENRQKKIYATSLEVGQKGEYASAPAEYLMPEKSPEEMSKLEQFESKLDQFGQKLDDAVTGTDQTFTYFKDPYHGFALAVPGEVLVYVYDPESRSLLLRLEILD